ncbi:hypothetical protein NL676_016814 [Syzygium grande]|nr:hypothetical protein NL676_016814 [Syzygium grande]
MQGLRTCRGPTVVLRTLEAGPTLPFREPATLRLWRLGSFFPTPFFWVIFGRLTSVNEALWELEIEGYMFCSAAFACVRKGLSLSDLKVFGSFSNSNSVIAH